MVEEVFLFPLSFAQERLWFMDQLLPQSDLFNLSTALRLTGQLDVAVLKHSLNEIIRRHEALRTTFAIVEERPVQLIAPNMSLALPVVDLRYLPPDQREAEASRLAAEEAHQTFDLTRGPLVRTKLLRLQAEEYVFLLTMHHIVSDGWSLGIFWKELGILWSAFASGKSSPLPELPIQYGDFAVWQRDWLQGGVLNSQLVYWRNQLSNLPTLQLPTDRPRPVVQTFCGARHEVKLPESLTIALKALSKRQGTTLFMTLLAAFQVLLYRYTGQEDIVVGTYIAGRNRAEIEALIGFFLNSLVIRTRLEGNLTFDELLARVRRITLDGYAHQDVPFAKLVEELQPVRDLSRNPLFQVMFQLLNVPTLSDIEAGPEPQLLKVESVTSVFDLSCMFQESKRGLRGHFEYNTDLFKARTITRMAGHYQTLLEGIVADSEQRLSDLPLLTEPEQHQLREWNLTGKPCPENPSIVQLFEAQARQRPEAAAFLWGGEQLSYGELNRRANRLAHHLRSIGVGPEILVGVCLERSPNLVVGLLGLLKAGGAYLPLDPGYPPERLAFMLKDAQVSVLLTDTGLVRMLPTDDLRIVCLDGEAECLARQDESNPTNNTTAGQLAYVIYTSGSTGKPKGVAVEHRQLLNRFRWMWEAYPLEQNEVGCQKTALSFVDSIWELFGPLLQGVPSVIISDRILKDPEALVHALADHNVTRLWVVPSLLHNILDCYPDLQDRLPKLKFWVTSGEPLSAKLLVRFKQVMPTSVLYNLYGTSEVWDATWYDTRTHNGALWRVPIGRPISNVQAYVLDPHLQPVPVGIPGELHIGGMGLARGFINRPEVTAEKFIPDTFSDVPGARLYKTGDLVRYLPDGNIEFIGRIDQQVKLRGFRIELEEVEWVLSQHRGVQQAVVIAREDEPEFIYLAAYIVPRSHVAFTRAELRNFMKEKLPEYMVPAKFVTLDSMPLTPSGKVNRRTLRGPETFDSDQTVDYVAPQTDVERTIVSIWQEALRTDKVGTRDNFFDLGGHSLLLFQVYSKLRQAFNQDLSMTDLFRYPTISSLAGYFNQQHRGQASFTRVRERVQKQREAMNRRSAGRAE